MFMPTGMTFHRSPIFPDIKFIIDDLQFFGVCEDPLKFEGPAKAIFGYKDSQINQSEEEEPSAEIICDLEAKMWVDLVVENEFPDSPIREVKIPIYYRFTDNSPTLPWGIIDLENKKNLYVSKGEFLKKYAHLPISTDPFKLGVIDLSSWKGTLTVDGKNYQIISNPAKAYEIIVKEGHFYALNKLKPSQSNLDIFS